MECLGKCAFVGHAICSCDTARIYLRIAWKESCIAIWDKLLVQHSACADYAAHARLMHRITIEGVPLARYWSVG
ncbi:MAG: TauD/TfdA family dioxygenase [Planktotalea sp.]|nr:TauD/TfdA family dioxygenase [Planktotalea sp.]MDG1075578.1 TauD/TfdA family dioxygenase [Planktotalea sp.]